MKQGFTLLEMLVVLSMIALLTVYILPFFQPVLAEAKLATSIKILTHNTYELQVKAQQGVRSKESSTPLDKPIDYQRKNDDAFPSYGIMFSKNTGVHGLSALLAKNENGYTLLTRTVEKDLLGSGDGAPSSTIVKNITQANESLEEVEFYFIPFSNTLLTRKNSQLSEEANIYMFTLASNRYPALTRTLSFNSATSLFTPMP